MLRPMQLVIFEATRKFCNRAKVVDMVDLYTIQLRANLGGRYCPMLFC